MVHASLAGRVARNALPVRLGAISNRSSRADIVANTLVHVEVVSAVEADEVLSASKAAIRTSLALVTKSSEALVARGLTNATLKEEGLNALSTDCSRSAALAARSAWHAVAGSIDEVLSRADALVVNGLGEGCHAGSASSSIDACLAVSAAGGTVPNTTIVGDSKVGCGRA